MHALPRKYCLYSLSRYENDLALFRPNLTSLPRSKCQFKNAKMINTFYSSFYWPEQVSSVGAYLLWRQVKVRVLRRDAVGLNGVLIQPSHIHQKGIFHEKYKCNFMNAKIQSMAGVEHVCSSYYNNSTKVHLSENKYKSYRENNDLI